MEREVSIVVEIGVALIALSAFIGILWFTVFMGQDMSNNISIEATEMYAVMQDGQLRDLTNGDNILPTSAVYSLLRSCSNVIGKVECHISDDCKDDTLGKCLLTHLNGKVNLEVILDDDGTYTLILHKADCLKEHTSWACN